MNPVTIIAIVVAVILIGLNVYSVVRRRKVVDELTTLLLKGKIEQFDALMEKKETKRLVHPFNYEYMQLSRYMMTGDNKKITELFDQFKTRRLNDAQKKEIALRGFNHFVSNKDKTRSTYYRDQLNELPVTVVDEATKKQVNLFYDVCIGKKTDMLDELLKQTEKVDEKYRSVNEYLISVIYENKGDKKKAEEYEELSKKHMMMLDKEMAEKYTSVNNQQDK